MWYGLPMSAKATADRYDRFQVRIPGWLLVGILVVAAGWLIAGRLSAGGDDDRLRFPARLTVLDSSVENRVFSATLLLEGNSTFDPGTAGFTLVLDDLSRLPVGAREVREGAWHGRSYVVAIDRLIPEGRTPVAIDLAGKNGGGTYSLPGAPTP